MTIGPLAIIAGSFLLRYLNAVAINLSIDWGGKAHRREHWDGRRSSILMTYVWDWDLGWHRSHMLLLLSFVSENKLSTAALTRICIVGRWVGRDRCGFRQRCRRDQAKSSKCLRINLSIHGYQQFHANLHDDHYAQLTYWSCSSHHNFEACILLTHAVLGKSFRLSGQ